VAAGPGQAPNAPISKAILATPAECTERRAGQRAPLGARAIPLGLEPPRVSG
jgi:hypothetical protein